jgi:hypothetical protein
VSTSLDWNDGLFGKSFPSPPSSRSGTSEEAADSVRESAATLRGRILALAIQRGLHGLTSWEAEAVLSLPNENGVHPRFWELETLSEAPAALKVREVVPRQLFTVKGIRRPSGKSGRSQMVYFAFAAVSVGDVLRHYGITP